MLSMFTVGQEGFPVVAGVDIRGMLRVILGNDTDQALAESDLRQAYELDSEALGDEPESHAAAAFLVEKALEAKDAAHANEYLKSFGGLRAFGSAQPFEATDAYAKLAKAVEAFRGDR